MRNELRERLATEVTRKQFLQYLAGTMLLVLGLGNLLSLLGGNKIIEKHVFLPTPAEAAHGFGSRKFGM